jgi:mono/diheme cytochrome c family protein
LRQKLAIVGGALAALLVAAGAWLAFVYSGFYNVAASQEHTPLVEWTFETISERSVQRHAGELPAPLPTDSASLLHGFEHYRAMCEVCHGGPGVDRGEIGEGLSPRPPRLVRAAQGWSDAELFWITKHGIKSTGMPGFGATHDDASLLQIVAVVRRLPDMSEEQYADWAVAVAAAGLDDHASPLDSVAGVAPGAAAGHTHAPGTQPHAH